MAEIFVPLSPAESLLLFNNGYSSRQALKVTLLQLIAREILRVETRQEQRVFRKEAVQHLRVLVHHVPDAPAHVVSLLDTLKAAGLSSGERGGSGRSEMLLGALRSLAPCHPAWSRIRMA